MPEDLEVPDDVDLTLNAEDPLVNWFFGFAKEHGLSQEIVDGAIKEYITQELAGIPKMDDVLGELGDYGKDRVQRITNWLTTKLSDDEVKSISPILSDAASIKALEKLMKSSGPGDFNSDTGGDALTLEELRTMQNDPRAWQQKDPAFLKKIEEGYKRLYGGRKTGT